MEINRSLLVPSLIAIKKGFEELESDLCNFSSEESLPLRSYVQLKLNQIQKIEDSIRSEESMIPYGFQQDVRQLKKRLHLAQRRWKLLLSNHSRIKRMQERLNHVSTFAA